MSPVLLAAVVVVGALALVALVLRNVASSEVQHVVFVAQLAFFAVAGGVLAVLVVPKGGALAGLLAFLLPAGLHHVRASLGRRRERAGRLDEARLAPLDSRAVVVELGRHSYPSLVASYLLARPDGRTAALACAKGSDDEAIGAAELAVFAPRGDRALAREIVAIVLARGAPARAVERALVAMRDESDAKLLELLRKSPPHDPRLRCAALEVRLRAGDDAALDEWLADATLNADETAGALALVLAGRGPGARERLTALKVQFSSDDVKLARLARLEDSLALFGRAR